MPRLSGVEQRRPWPTDWDELRRGKGCAFCAEGRPVENPYGVRIFEGHVLDAYLQRRAPSRGYTIAVWRGRHVAGPGELSVEEAASYGAELVQATKALEEYYQPAQTTFLTLGLQIAHLHTNVVLRYLDDGHPGEPLDLGVGERVEPAQLKEDAAQLRKLLAPRASL